MQNRVTAPDGKRNEIMLPASPHATVRYKYTRQKSSNNSRRTSRHFILSSTPVLRNYIHELRCEVRLAGRK